MFSIIIYQKRALRSICTSYFSNPEADCFDDHQESKSPTWITDISHLSKVPGQEYIDLWELPEKYIVEREEVIGVSKDCISEEVKNWNQVNTDSWLVEDFNMRRSTAADYDLPEWTSWSFMDVRNDEWEGLREKYESWTELTDTEKKNLAKYLYQYSQENWGFYLVPNFVLMVKLDPENYTEIAKDHILRFTTNIGWSDDVIWHLREIWVSESEVRQSILTIANGFHVDVLRDKASYEYSGNMSAMVSPLSQIWEEWNAMLDLFEKTAKELGNDRLLSEIQRTREFWKINSSSSYGNTTWFETTIDWKRHLVIYRNKDSKRVIPEGEYDADDIMWEVKKYSDFLRRNNTI